MRIGLFGGTFDPPHRAHVMAILWALQTGDIDRVLMIPTARHAFGKEPVASFDDRFAMCRLAIRELGSGLVQVDPIENERDGTSYMIDTVRALEDEFPGTEWRLVVGTDIVDDLDKWHESKALLALAPPLVVPRQVTGDAVRPGALPMLSSTEVRGLLSDDEDRAAALIPARVLNYIRDRKLYRAPAVST